jgi:hypothetical protein
MSSAPGARLHSAPTRPSWAVEKACQHCIALPHQGSIVAKRQFAANALAFYLSIYLSPSLLFFFLSL